MSRGWRGSNPHRPAPEEQGMLALTSRLRRAYDTEVTLEDALPKIKRSRIRRDKRVFGVLGDKRRTNNRPERLIVNSVGEGGDRPGFGVHLVTQKLSAYNIIRVLNIIKIKLYNII